MRTKIVVSLLAMLVCVSLALATQTSEPPAGSNSFGLLEIFASVTVLAAFVVPATELVTKAINAVFKVVVDGLPARLLSWVVSIVICVAAAYFKLGFFADIATVYSVPLTGSLVGLATGFIANGFFTADVATALLAALKIKIPVTQNK